MFAQVSPVPVKPCVISLVDGDATLRRGRQLMLRSERFDVRAYATCATVLADPRARASSCVVVDVEMPEMSGTELVRMMRLGGWRGSAIFLTGSGVVDPAIVNGDLWLPESVADWSLLEAIRSAQNISAAPAIHRSP
ncbi:MAG: response regulator [Sphingomonas sp.]